MFSSLPRRFSAWSLRTRLLAGLLLVLFAVCAIIGTITTLAMHQNLMQQVDENLRSASARSSGKPPPNWRDERPAFRGQPVGTLIATVYRGTAVSADISDNDGVPQSADASVRDIVARIPADRQPRTYDLGENLGSYRLRADPDGGRVVVTGLPLEPVNDTIWWLIGVEIVVTLGGLLVVAGAGPLIVQRALRPLNRVAATAARVAELPLDRGEVALSVRVPEADTDPRTEVGKVGAALNRMLGHVAAALNARHASETRVRQFVADASHELRTPLASIKGYAELARRHRDGVPDDVAYAITRVESEAARMTTLVEDLLLLARLDAGRPLHRDQVDLSRLIVDTVNDAHVASPEHRWQLDLPDEAVTVSGDEARLHQVLANLLTNARVHTPAGTTVTVRLRTESTWSVVEVEDDGPGIPANLLPDLFERFSRGDTSRSRAAGSTGLGLAIVAAVVEAHGGHVEVASAAGRTAFTVRLPLLPRGIESVNRAPLDSIETGARTKDSRQS
jgi:two-component system, OmpR family, sensor kinase